MKVLQAFDNRDREFTAVMRKFQKNLALNRKSCLSIAEKNVRSGYVCSSTIAREQISLYRDCNLLAAGDIFIKPSRFQRPRRHFAELRGSSLVVFRNHDIARSSSVDITSVVTVITVQRYNFDIIQKAEGYPRIYISAEKSDESFMYIKVNGGHKELDSWRHGLAMAKSAAIPKISNLTVESVIGRGGGGRVFMVQWGESNKAYALKVIDKAQAFRSPKAFAHIASERNIMQRVGRHPFLLDIQFAFQTENSLFIGTPFCGGGDLASYIRHRGLQTPSLPSFINGGTAVHPHKRLRTHGRLCEASTRSIAAEIILGLEHLHDRGIVYRDLKPENIFIDDSGHLRIGDYGLAKHLSRKRGKVGHKRTSSICGTRNYLPPEMLSGRTYAFSADLWCLGVMLFRMLIGSFPFEASRTKEVFHKVRRYQPRYPAWLSTDAKSMLNGLLQKDPSNRTTIKGLKRHPFFRDVDWKAVLELKAGPAIDDIETGSQPSDALANFSLSKLHGLTMGELVCEEEKPQRPFAEDLSTMMVGFEFGCVEERSSVQPLAVQQKSGGILSKIASIDQTYDSLASFKSLRSSRGNHGQSGDGDGSPSLRRAWRSAR